jgi:NADH-quinone oxidoreductase subunit E
LIEAAPHTIEIALLLLVALSIGLALGYGAKRIAGRRRPSRGAAVVPTTAAKADAPPTQPVQVSTPAPVNAPSLAGGDVRQIRGVGPKMAAGLAEQGVTDLGQIAMWTSADVDRIESALGMRGRVAREQWIEQAKALMAERHS